MAYPEILFEGVEQIRLRTKDGENGDLGAIAPYPLVKGSGGSCNLVQEISYSKTVLIFGIFRLVMMTTNLFVIVNVKQLRTDGSFRILLSFSEQLGVLAS